MYRPLEAQDLRLWNGNQYGSAWDERPSLNVKWLWLVFPLASLAFSLFFVVSVIMKSSRESSSGGIWKIASFRSYSMGLAMM
jgi:hypothetical protein